MKFGLAFASSIGTEGNSAVEICKLAEQVGFESVWGGEHSSSHHQSSPNIRTRRMAKYQPLKIPGYLTL